MKCPVCNKENSLIVVVKEILQERSYSINSEGYLQVIGNTDNILDMMAYCRYCDTTFDEGMIECNRSDDGYPLHIINIEE